MNETSTKTFNTNVKKTALKNQEDATLTDVDDMMFYHAIRLDLDMLQRMPKKSTIDRILNFSRSMR